MIDHTYRCIYIHQRKAAGSSVIATFGLTPQDENWHAFNDGVLGKEWRRRTDERSSYFVFSSVRNPFDRVVSGWQYLKPLRHLSLREVLENPPLEGHPFRHFTRPQVAILKDRSGRIVADDLIRYETLQDDFDRISDKIGRPRQELARWTVNEKRGRDYRPYFDDHTRAFATEMFREDLETFGYSFDGPGL